MTNANIVHHHHCQVIQEHSQADLNKHANGLIEKKQYRLLSFLTKQHVMCTCDVQIYDGLHVARKQYTRCKHQHKDVHNRRIAGLTSSYAEVHGA